MTDRRVGSIRYPYVLEARDGLPADHDGFQEHRQGSHPEAAIAVILLVNDRLFQ